MNAQGNVNLNRGAMLVSAPRNSIVTAGGYSIQMKKNSIALFTLQSGVLKVHNLHDSNLGSVAVGVGKQWVPVHVGSEMVIADHSSEVLTAMSNDAIGRRRVKAIENGSEHGAFASSEFSLPTLVEFSGLLRQVLSSSEHEDQKIKDTIMKTAVSVYQTTGAHGAYSTVQSIASR
jgi:hypothetical protein